MLARSNRHPQLLRHEDTVLLVVDVQGRLVDVMHEAAILTDNIVKLAHCARMLRMDMVYTVQNMQKLGEIIQDLKPYLPATYIPFSKMTFSAMATDGIRSEVVRTGRRQVLICGVEAHVCVLQTVHDLLQMNYQVHVVADAISSRFPVDREVAIDRMRSVGALLTTTETAIFELLEEAGTPEFREMLDLIRDRNK